MTRHLLLYLCLSTGFLGLIGWLGLEAWRHRRNLDTFEWRILVNGIRGKSSITRLIWGALHQQAVTVAKTTGTAARIILPYGREVPIKRPYGLVNVIEQVGVVAQAVAADAHALVVECMAVDPALQELNGRQLIRPDITVISNVREDHLAEMGPALDDVARSLSRSLLPGTVCVTAERDRLPILTEEARKRDCLLIYADPDAVTDAEMAGFGWITFKENVAIALAVAEQVGIDRATALAGMYEARPDPGVLRVDRVEHRGRRFETVNLFAANDPNSTLANIELLRQRRLLRPRLSIVINCRPDRMDRNGQMGELVERLRPASVHVIGTPTRSAVRTIAPSHRGLVHEIDGEEHSGGELLDRIVANLPPGDQSLIMIGNIHGRGEHLLEALDAVRLRRIIATAAVRHRATAVVRHRATAVVRPPAATDAHPTVATVAVRRTPEIAHAPGGASATWTPADAAANWTPADANATTWTRAGAKPGQPTVSGVR